MPETSHEISFLRNISCEGSNSSLFLPIHCACVFCLCSDGFERFNRRSVGWLLTLILIFAVMELGWTMFLCTVNRPEKLTQTEALLRWAKFQVYWPWHTNGIKVRENARPRRLSFQDYTMAYLAAVYMADLGTWWSWRSLGINLEKRRERRISVTSPTTEETTASRYAFCSDLSSLFSHPSSRDERFFKCNVNSRKNGLNLSSLNYFKFRSKQR